MFFFNKRGKRSREVWCIKPFLHGVNELSYLTEFIVWKNRVAKHGLENQDLSQNSIPWKLWKNLWKFNLLFVLRQLQPETFPCAVFSVAVRFSALRIITDQLEPFPSLSPGMKWDVYDTLTQTTPLHPAFPSQAVDPPDLSSLISPPGPEYPPPPGSP